MNAAMLVWQSKTDMMQKNQAQPIPLIDLARCSGCGLCAELCPTRAVDIVVGKPVIARPAACTYCEVCEHYCPEGAIGRPFVIVFAPGRGPH